MVVRSAGLPSSWLDSLQSGAAVSALREGDVGAAQVAYEAETAETSTAVIRWFQEESALRDAVQFANPSLWRLLSEWLERRAATTDGWRSADRQRIDTLTRMFQRYCAKNETTSHVGPITPALLSRSRQGVDCRPGLPLRQVRLSHWAAERLQESFLADTAVPHSWWRPRITPGCHLAGNDVSIVRYNFAQRHECLPDAVTDVTERRLTATETRILRWCNGSRSVAEILERDAAAHHAPLSEAQAVTALRSLEALGAVVTGPEFPYGIHDALPLLRSRAAESADHKAEQHLNALDAALEDLASAADEHRRATAIAAVETAFTAATGEAPRRAAGVTYGDRTVYNEDCGSEYGSMLIGEPLPGLMERELAFVYDLFLVLPRVRLHETRRVMHRWFQHVFGAGATVTVHDFVTACLQHDAALSAGFDEVEAVVSARSTALTALLAPGEQTGRIHRLSAEAISAALALTDEPSPAVCNPDLMLAADDAEAVARGDFLAVIGDLHAAEEGLSHSLFAPWMEKASPGQALGEQVAAAYRAILEPGEDLADVTHRHRSKHYARTGLPCLDVEAADRSPVSAHARTRLHELMISDAPRGLRLHLPGSDRGLRFTSPPLYWQGVRARNPFAVFSFPQRVDGLPVPLGDRLYLPRLVYGRVVLQRAMWALPATAFHGRTWFAGFQGVQDLRSRHQLPRHMFVKFPQEVKPIYCDLDSPLLVRQVSHLAKAAGNRSLIVSEMIPAPDQLWLESSRGRVTSEFRYAVFSGGTERPPPNSSTGSQRRAR
ncbi:lantibiotic dehydratase [Streptomyces sp. QTS52]